MGIRRERRGWRASTRVAGKLLAKRFPADASRGSMEDWINAQRSKPRTLSVEEAAGVLLWEAYRPGWIVGLVKRPSGSKTLGLGGRD